MNGEMSHRDDGVHPHPPMHIDPLGPYAIRAMLYGPHCLLIGYFYHFVRYLHPPAHFPSSVESQEIL